jgi:hypothetical protein
VFVVTVGHPARFVAAAVAALLLVLAAPAGARAAGWTDADYWRFADRLQERLDESWRSQRRLYRPGDMTSDAMVNANLLLVHSVAALRGHQGPARQDDRARAIAAAMVKSPPFVEVLDRQFGQRHAPGWAGSMSSTIGMQHLVVDAEVAEALAAAWRARDVLALPPETVALIQDRLYRVATSAFWRYPAIRLNQLNWHAAIYAAAAEVTGDLSLLHRDLRAQVARFVRGIRRPEPGTAGNLGPGMRFHYLPAAPRSLAGNLDSAEYANIVVSFARFWDGARLRGMASLPAEDRALLGRWMQRVLAGYWTHAGYLNWDTGFGFGRLHQAKKIGLSQQGLLALAQGGELSPGSRWESWAKYMLDQGFGLYERWLPEKEGLPAATLFDLSANHTTESHAVLAASRVQANAARAIAANLAARPSAEPPPLYAFDPDVGRLAITTPRYSTAIVPVSQGAFPYGGIDIARLFDGRQEVAGSIGGVPPAAFGLVVRDSHEDVELATQRPRRRLPDSAPLRLMRAPSGVGARLHAPPDRAFAGPFSTLQATGEVHRNDLIARTTYRFSRRWIQASWSVEAPRPKTKGKRAKRATPRRHTVEVHFPSWQGDGQAQVTAELSDGRRIPLAVGAPVPLIGITAFEIRSDRAGYRVVPLERPSGAVAEIVQPDRQSSAPRPGPTLTIRLAYRSRIRQAEFAARLVPGA